MNERTPRPINLAESGMDQNGNFIMGQPDVPPVLRYKGVRIIWNLPNNTTEENEQLGIKNIQGLFLEKFPEFDELFPRGEDGKIAEDKREDAKRFIYEKIGDSVKFTSVLGGSPIIKIAVPYFEGQYVTVIQKSFIPWGLSFEVLSTKSGKRLIPPSFYEDRATSRQTIIDNIEKEFLSLIGDGVKFDRKSLRTNNLARFERDVVKYYPGGFTALRKKFEVRIDRRPRTYWTGPQAIQNVRDEALKFYQQFGKLTYDALVEQGRFDLANAIGEYPGCYVQLKSDIGIPLSRRDNYWTVEQIKKDAKEFYEREGRISHKFLVDKGFSSLASKISTKYPGSYMQLRIDLGIEVKRKDKYWTNEKIEKDALVFFQQYGDISYALLNQNGRSDLGNQINRHYSGNMTALKAKLDINGGYVEVGQDNLAEVQINLESLSDGQRYEINERFWEFIQENPDSKISILDFAVDYLRKKGT